MCFSKVNSLSLLSDVVHNCEKFCNAETAKDFFFRKLISRYGANTNHLYTFKKTRYKKTNYWVVT